MIKINKEYCKGCKLCIENCPKKCISLSKEVNDKGYFYAVYKEGCTSCKFCALICPDACIEVIKE
ncbi:ferredoxin family protein [Candidatus Woesearchaeota archaeon]|nr:ferredoxin family protein [Candidatus Woesearchaeota archaeon]